MIAKRAKNKPFERRMQASEQKQRRKTRKRLNHFADCQMKRSFRVSIGDAINP
jgi:hypothetical protein